MTKYATVLLEHCSIDTTQLYVDYFTGQFRPKKDAVVITEVPQEQAGRLASTMNTASAAVQNLAALLPLPYMSTTVVEAPSTDGDQKTTVSQAQIVETTDSEPPVEYDVPKPRTAFSAFVDHPSEFVVFLEACVKSQQVKDDDKVDLYTTLFEMYLQASNSTKVGEKEQWEGKAKRLLEDQNVSKGFPLPKCLLANR